MQKDGENVQNVQNVEKNIKKKKGTYLFELVLSRFYIIHYIIQIRKQFSLVSLTRKAFKVYRKSDPSPQSVGHSSFGKPMRVRINQVSFGTRRFMKIHKMMRLLLWNDLNHILRMGDLLVNFK